VNHNTCAVLSHVPVNFRLVNEAVYDEFYLPGFVMKQNAVAFPYFFPEVYLNTMAYGAPLTSWLFR